MESADEEIAVVITETVSNALDAPIEELPPLSEAVDLEALDTLVGVRDGGPVQGVTVTFRYSGLRVLVHSGKTVFVSPIQGDGYDLVEHGAP